LVLDCESEKKTQQGKMGEGELLGGVEVETRREEEKIMAENN
jgi:hypothetical protein